MNRIILHPADQTLPEDVSAKFFKADIIRAAAYMSECCEGFLEWRVGSDYHPGVDCVAGVEIRIGQHPRWPHYTARLEPGLEKIGVFRAVFDEREDWNLRKFFCWRLGSVSFFSCLIHELCHIAHRGHVDKPGHILAPAASRVWYDEPEGREFVRREFMRWNAGALDILRRDV